MADDSKPGALLPSSDRPLPRPRSVATTFLIIVPTAVTLAVVVALLKLPLMLGQFGAGMIVGALFGYRHYAGGRLAPLAAAFVFALTFGLLFAASGWVGQQLFPV